MALETRENCEKIEHEITLMFFFLHTHVKPIPQGDIDPKYVKQEEVKNS